MSGATWRLVLARARADWLVTSAAALVILVATTLLSSGLIYADAVTLQGLHRALADAPVRQANIELSTRANPAARGALDAAVRQAVAATFATSSVRVAGVEQSDSFALPQQPAEGVRNLAVFGAYDSIEAHANLISGSWPRPRVQPAAPMEVAVPGRAASELGIGVGDRLTMSSRLDTALVVQVAVTGIYQIDDPRDPFWWDEPLELDGATISPNYTTYGLFILAEADLPAVATRDAVEVAWRLSPDLRGLDLDGIDPLRGQVGRLDDAVAGAVASTGSSTSPFSVSTGLDGLLADVQRALLATRTGVLLLLVQLIVLAAYALLLTAALLVEQRRVESAMLHARGASNRQLVTLAVSEGLVLAIPAAAAAPWLASIALRLFDRVGPLAEIGLRLEPRVSLAAYLVAGLGAGLAVLAMVVPAVRAARSLSAASRAKGRQERTGMAQRVGLDLALVVAAAVGLWQLRTYGSVLTTQVRGGLGIDPLLVAAPAIGLVAGSIFALRLIPLLAQLAESVVARRRGAVASLGAWQLARRPGRYTRSALLLTLTVALGGFAALYIATWSGSQRDQAAYQVGADLRVQPDHRIGSLPPIVLPSAYRGVPGLEDAMPVRRDEFSLTRTGGRAALLALDAGAAARVVAWRADEAAESLDALMSRLAAARPRLGGPILPGSPVRIAAELGLVLDPLPRGAHRPAQVGIRLLLQDGAGLIHQVSMGQVPVRNAVTRLEATLGTPDEKGSWSGMRAPVRLLSVSVVVDLPSGDTVLGAALSVRSVESSESGTGNGWIATELGGNWQATTLGVVPVGGAELAPAGAGQLGLRIETGVSTGPVHGIEDAIQQAGVGSAIQVPLAAIANRDLLDAAGVRVGDTLALDLGGVVQPVRIVGLVGSFPTLEEGQPVLIVDLPSLAGSSAAVGLAPEPAEWWMAVDPGSEADAAAALRATPFTSTSVLDRAERARSLQTDPLALGVIGALGLGFVASALFAAIGFAVSAAVSARERLTEFAVLRALGLSNAQLAGWLALEHALLVAVSLVSGTGLGLLLGWLVLPFVTMRRDPGPVVPAPAISVPWAGIASLEAVVVAVLIVTVAVLVVLLRRIGLGSALRLGED